MKRRKVFFIVVGVIILLFATGFISYEKGQRSLDTELEDCACERLKAVNESLKLASELQAEKSRRIKVLKLLVEYKDDMSFECFEKMTDAMK